MDPSDPLPDQPIDLETDPLKDCVNGNSNWPVHYWTAMNSDKLPPPPPLTAPHRTAPDNYPTETHTNRQPHMDSKKYPSLTTQRTPQYNPQQVLNNQTPITQNEPLPHKKL